MKKLKILLHCNFIYYIFLIFVLLISLVRININHKSIYKIDEQIFKGTITDIK